MRFRIADEVEAFPLASFPCDALKTKNRPHFFKCGRLCCGAEKFSRELERANRRHFLREREQEMSRHLVRCARGDGAAWVRRAVRAHLRCCCVRLARGGGAAGNHFPNRRARAARRPRCRSNRNRRPWCVRGAASRLCPRCSSPTRQRARCRRLGRGPEFDPRWWRGRGGGAVLSRCCHWMCRGGDAVCGVGGAVGCRPHLHFAPKSCRPGYCPDGFALKLNLCRRAWTWTGELSGARRFAARAAWRWYQGKWPLWNPWNCRQEALRCRLQARRCGRRSWAFERFDLPARTGAPTTRIYQKRRSRNPGHPQATRPPKGETKFAWKSKIKKTDSRF